jgi:hypothetical protein
MGLALAGVVVAAAPAEARGYHGGGGGFHGGGYGYRGGYRGGYYGGGAVAAGIIGLGVGAALASNYGYYGRPYGYYGGYYAPGPYAYGYGYCHSDWRWDGYRGEYVRVRYCD